MEMIIDVLADALADCLKMLPFFCSILLIEGLEHYSTKLTRKALEDVDKAGPVVGALVGCVPQCGFSVMASNLLRRRDYIGRNIAFCISLQHQMKQY